MSSVEQTLAVNGRNKDFRERFADTASAYRKRNLQLGFILVPVVLVFWYLVFLVPSAAFLGLLVFFVGFVVLVFGKRTLPKLICPACELYTDGEIVRFCPECGSEDLQMKGDDKYFLVWPRCRSCGKQLSRKPKNGRRLYRVRFCTRCGAYLDEQGV
jgi:hypothetical protein